MTSESTELGSPLDQRRSEKLLLINLHWLPIALRVEFNIPLLIHRALTGHVPGYIEQCVSRRQPVRSLRFSEHN